MGPAGEAAALDHLQELGYRVLAVDWRCRVGQADLIALDGDVVVLVEVKSRRSTRFGLPQESVDSRKQRKLRAVLEAYRMRTGRQSQPCRIDVVALLLDDGLRVRSCEHIVDAVRG